MEHLISVVIPVYNVENYLEECIQSVLNQTYTNMDIVLVSDGSTDASVTICEGFSRLETYSYGHTIDMFSVNPDSPS